ncbi:RNA polymerase sigma-70 factor (ECF subfamily) [Sporosarcina luteola]|nr:RNA polymerase sigma-70 factor (ECF subfamily) [Sporosarcina luteola]
MKDHHDIEDVFHNTILKVHEKIGQLRQDDYFETWVTSIFINECRAIYRKKNRQVAECPPETADERPIEDRLELMENLDQLDSHHKEAIILKYLQGYSQQEIADIVNVPVGTVKSRLYRGLSTLRKLMEGGEGNEL